MKPKKKEICTISSIIADEAGIAALDEAIELFTNAGYEVVDQNYPYSVVVLSSNDQNEGE